MKNKRQQSGFTLVELAIVLVIIGLIIGGVLVGQDLIKAATLRAATAQLDKYDSAANTFRNKYNALPGDLPSPDSFFPTITNGNNAIAGRGNGDGLVQSITDDTGIPCGGTTTSDAPSASNCISGEALIFWSELALAGLITEPITTTNLTNTTITPSDSNVPQSKLGKGARVTVNAIAGRNYYVLGNPQSSPFSSGAGTWKTGLTGIDAFNLDTKVDDGVPTTGKLLSVDDATPIANEADNGSGTLAAGVCYDSTTTPPHYSTGTYADEMNCNIGIRTSF